MEIILLQYILNDASSCIINIIGFDPLKSNFLNVVPCIVVKLSEKNFVSLISKCSKYNVYFVSVSNKIIIIKLFVPDNDFLIETSHIFKFR